MLLFHLLGYLSARSTGTRGEWASALGTFSAAALLSTVEVHRVVTERRARREDHAMNVSSWMDWRLDDGSGKPELVVTVQNSGGHPVYDLNVWLVDEVFPPPTGIDQLTEAEARPEGQPAQDVWREYWAVFAPGTKETVRAEDVVVAPPSDAFLGVSRPAAELTFTDAAGLHWHRGSRGGLKRIRQNPGPPYVC